MSHLLRGIESINNRLGSIEQRLAKVEAKLETMPICPNPAECGNIRTELDEMKDETNQTLAALREDVDEHRLLVAKLDGGWRMLVVIASACSTLGGLAGWAISHLSK